MATERQNWVWELVNYTVDHPGTFAQTTVQEFLGDTVPAFGRWWRRLTPRSRNNFVSDVNGLVYLKRREMARKDSAA